MVVPQKPIKRIQLPQVSQKTWSHCGPATLQMLLAHVGLKISQDDIVAAARIKSRIHRYGMRPDKMVMALKAIDPHLAFWYKQPASIRELEALVKTYHYPVGVNWQNLFYDTVAEEKKRDPNGDHGHYSVVVGLDRKQDIITHHDPFPEFASRPRHFPYAFFRSRWWDYVDLKDPETNHIKRVHTRRLLFIITPAKTTFPIQLGLHPGEELYAYFS